MLRRRFKPEKCKIALKLAIPRIKVMRNKREAQFKQFKRELAQLLESGQDQTARIRVEHVVREEKTMVAYDLLEIYCELIVARMPSIESQKNCPIDLKEAISSVIFASARCEEIPELKDVTKHLTTKYGKDFTTSALELHPDSGVGRMLVDKLSVKAADGPTKLKILTAIAEEHNIKWDPESFGAKESKVYDNLMNRPSTLPEATKISAGPHNTQASTSYYVQRPPCVQDLKHIAKGDVPSSFYEHKSRLSPHPKNFDYSNTSANNSISSGAYHPRSKPQQTENQGMEFRNSSYRNESASPGEHGNMEFKDATAAAQVAAESAERASMAARATAELSSHGNIAPQYSMKSNISGHGMRDEEPKKYIGSTSHYEYLARHPVDTSFHERNSTKYEQTDSNEQHNRTGETENGFTNFVKNDGKSTHCSSKSTADSFNEKPSVNNQIPDAYSQINSSVGREMEHFTEVTMKRNSGNEMQFVNELHGIKNPQNVDDHDVSDCEQSSYSSHSRSNTFINDCDVASNLDCQKSENDNRNSGDKMQFVNELHDRKNYDVTDYQEERIGKQSSFSSSSSSSTFNDDVYVVSNFNHQKLGNFSVDNSVLLNDKGSLQRNTFETTYTYDNASAVSDDYGSYNDEGTFDFEEEHKVHEDNMNLSYPFQRSPAHPCPCTNSLGFKQKVESQEEPYSQSHIFSEQRSTPVFFERSTSSAVPSHGKDLRPTFDKYGPSSESEDEVDKSDRNNNPSIGSQKRNMDSYQAENSVFNQRLAGGMEDTELSNDSSPEESKELNFGKLIGGLRNKGYRHPPYLKIPQGSALSSGEAENNTSARIKQTSPPLAVEDSISTRFYNQEWCSRKGSDEVSQKLNKRISVTRVDSSDDDFEEERPKQIFSSTRDLYNILPSSEENKRSTSRVPMPYFDSGNSDSDEDLPKTGSKVHSSIGFSHKTTASPNSGKGSTLKATVSSESTLVSNPIPYFGPGNSDSDEDLPKTSSKARSSTIFSHRTTASPNARRGSALKTTVSSESKLVFDPMPHFGPGNSDSDEDIPERSSKARSSMIFSHRTTASPNARRGSTLKTTVSSESKVVSDPMPYLGPGNSGSDEDLPETSSKAHSSTGFSHKTNDSPSNSRRGSTLKTTVSFEPAVVSNYGEEKNSSSRSCSADEALLELQSHKRNSDNRESFQNSQLAPETKMNSSDGSSKSSENEQPSTSVPMIVSSGSAESSKAQNSTEGRPSYVHPKLPDYDTLAAHLNSLRQNHQ